MTIAALCLFAMVTLAQKTIRVAAGKTDLVMQVSPKGRLYQVYLERSCRTPLTMTN